MVHENNIDPWALLNGMTESVILTDTDLDFPGPRIIYVNPAFEKMTGWTSEEAVGKSPRLLQGSKTDSSIFSDFKTALSEGRIWQGQTINYRKDGSEFVMEWSIIPIRNDQGKIIQYLGVQKDVTEKVLLEKELEQSRKLERNRYNELEISNKKLNELNEEIASTLDLFYKYVPEQVIKNALKSHRHSVFEGEELDAALLFCDLRNFTSICENISPGDVVFLLNSFYKVMSRVIKTNHGTINQFVGDEIFVSFGTPVFIQNPEEHAVRCAVEMIDAVQELNELVHPRIRSKISVGIGINFGKVIAGNLGSEDRLSYSLTGDTVNTAKRIEMLSKDRPNRILASESIYNSTKHIINARSLGNKLVKGKNDRIEVFEITSLKEKDIPLFPIP